jgi:hypothetical protein
MQAAWTAAALGRVKKFPALATLMHKPAAKPKRTSWQTMYAAAAAWVAAEGEIRTEGDA